MTAQTPRFRELMQAASEAFEENIDPFSGGWLAKHDVSLDECLNLSLGISAAIDLFLVMMGQPKKEAAKR